MEGREGSQLQMNDGARVTVMRWGQVAHHAYSGDLSVFTVIPPRTYHRQPSDLPFPSISLMRQENAEVAYAVLPRPPMEIGIDKHSSWGKLYIGVMYARCGDTQFQAPENPTYVAIKRLNKQVVHRYLEQGGPKNPYRRVACMKAIGDDVHVLRCIDFLEDKDYLYIITLAACSLGTLADYQWDTIGSYMDQERRLSIIHKIRQIQLYLEQNMMNHRDLNFGPDDFVFLTQNNLVLSDGHER
jgi:hypothetical protein